MLPENTITFIIVAEDDIWCVNMEEEKNVFPCWNIWRFGAMNFNRLSPNVFYFSVCKWKNLVTLIWKETWGSQRHEKSGKLRTSPFSAMVRVGLPDNWRQSIHKDIHLPGSMNFPLHNPTAGVGLEKAV